MNDNGFGAFLKCRWIKHLVQTIEMKSELICFTSRYKFARFANFGTKLNYMINRCLQNSVIGRAAHAVSAVEL